jgi:bacillithiol disulfide reductase
MSISLDVLIVGGGPAGLAAAIAARQHGLRYQVLEQGALVNSLMRYPTHMVFFTTPELLEIGGMPFVSPFEKPTRQEALRYYRRVTDAFELQVAQNEPVIGLTARDGVFHLRSQRPHAPHRDWIASAVVIATGAYDVPNELGIPGEHLPHVSHFYLEPHAYYRRRVVIVGGKNSAAEAALDLYRAGASVLIVHRHPALGESIKYWVKPDIENRIKEGTIQARFSTRVIEIRPGEVVLAPADSDPSRDIGAQTVEPAEGVFLLTGYRSDTTLLRMAGAAIDEAQGAPVHDPETFETTVPNLFLAGAVIAGRQSGRIFIENGRFHGRVVIEEIAKRLQMVSS